MLSDRSAAYRDSHLTVFGGLLLCLPEPLIERSTYRFFLEIFWGGREEDRKADFPFISFPIFAHFIFLSSEFRVKKL